MRTRFLVPFLWLLCTTTICLAQPGESGLVKGLIIEHATEEPMEYVNILLFEEEEEETHFKGATTNQEGAFVLADIPFGKYYLQISFIGFETRRTRVFSINKARQEIDFRKIEIYMDETLLQEVEVVAERSTYSNNLKRKVYNVEKDIMSQSSSATEILQNLPSVRVDVNGDLSLRGSSNITYLLNGRPSALLRANPTAFLTQLPANSIERVEVITNPSAKYRPDGIGGIINIVLKEKTKEGWNGTVQGDVGNLQRYNGNITLNYGEEDLQFFTSYGLRSASTPQDIFDKRIDRDGKGNNISTFESVSDALFDEFSQTLNSGLNLALGDNSNLEIAGQYFLATNDNYSLTNWKVVDDQTSAFSIDRTYESREQEYEIGATFEHQLDGEDHTLAFDFTYAAYDESEDNIYDQIYTLPGSARSMSHNLIQKGGPITEFAIEYAKVFGEDTELEAGYLGEYLRDDIRLLYEDLDADNNRWITDFSRTNRFKFRQDIHALYALFDHAIDIFSFSAGIRAEQALITSRLIDANNNEVPNNYFRLYPSLTLGLELGDFEELQLSYSRRVNRPDSDEMNPFPEYDDPRTRDAGNPLLLPENIHSVELAYLLERPGFSFIPSLYYRYKYDGFTEVRELVEDSILHTSFTNLATDEALGLELVFRGTVSNNLYLNWSANFFRNTIDASNLGFSSRQSQFTWDTKLAANWNISKKTYAQLNAQYLSSRLTPQGQFRPLILLNMGLRHDIFRSRGTLVLTISDVFASLEWESVIDNPNLFWNTSYARNNQIVHLGFSFRFGGKFGKKRPKLEFEDMIEIPHAPEEEEEEEEEGE